MQDLNLESLINEFDFGLSPSAEDLAKRPVGDPAGDYYRKLVALKQDPRWKGHEAAIDKRIQDLVTRISFGVDKGLPVNAQGQAEPETDYNKFIQKNPSFKESVNESAELDRIKELTKILKG